MAYSLKELWRDLTFQGVMQVDALDVVIVLIMWIFVLVVLGLVVICVGWIVYTIYRVIAYDYEIETLPAKVTRKKYEAEYTMYTYNAALKIPTPMYHDAEYNVYFVTKRYGLQDVIDDEELYEWAKKGSEFKVTIKIGRDRSPDRKIKYWRVTRYAWRCANKG